MRLSLRMKMTSPPCQRVTMRVRHILLSLTKIADILIYVAWFKRPKRMPNWLYAYFRDTIEPMIKKKNGRSLVQPPSFTDAKSHAPSSFWIYPPEPALVLRRQKFDPTILYLPRVFLWLPHFLVKT